MQNAPFTLDPLPPNEHTLAMVTASSKMPMTVEGFSFVLIFDDETEQYTVCDAVPGRGYSGRLTYEDRDEAYAAFAERCIRHSWAPEPSHWRCSCDLHHEATARCGGCGDVDPR